MIRTLFFLRGYVMNGSIFWLGIGVFVGAYLTLDNPQAAAWFEEIFTMLDDLFGNS